MHRFIMPFTVMETRSSLRRAVAAAALLMLGSLSATSVALADAGQYTSPRLSKIGLTIDNGGWSTNHPRYVADVDGDGRADIVGFGDTAVHMARSYGDGTFAPPVLSTIGMTIGNGGWRVDAHPRYLADVNGDGRADIVGFGANHVHTALANADGTFAPPVLSTIGMTIGNGGWTVNDHPRYLADVNGDGRADIVGFGATAVHVALSNGTGTFASPVLSTIGMTVGNGGWTQDHPRHLADVNGDGRADIVGFGSTAVHAALSNGDGTFASPVLSTIGLTIGNGGWRVDTHPRYLADVNGDGRADIVGFGATAVHVALSNGNGSYAAPVLSTIGMTIGNGGWTIDGHPRLVADINGDGRADIVGFGSTDVHGAVAWSPAHAFGYLRRPITGVMPLLTLPCTMPGDPARERNAANYQSLLFGPQGPNLNTLMDSMSNGVFKFANAGILEPISTSDRAFRSCLQSAAAGPFNLSLYDRDRNNVVDHSELAILYLYDDSGFGQTAHNDTCPHEGGGTCFRGLVSGLTENGALDLFAHELLHAVSGYTLTDIYGFGCKSNGLSLMSCSSIGSRRLDAADRNAYHLDPYYKMVAGWIIPRIVETTGESGCANLTAPAVRSTRMRPGPILIPDRSDSRRFLMVEFRNDDPEGGSLDDRAVAGEGVAIWYVERNAAGDLFEIDDVYSNWSVGAPTGVRGGTQLWTAAHGNFTVSPDRDGPVSSLGALVMRVGPFADTSASVDVMWTPRGQATRWRVDRVSERAVARGQRLVVMGALGVDNGDSRVVLRRGSVTHVLPTERWSCGEATVTVPATVPAGTYDLRVQTQSSGGLSNAMSITVE